MARLKRGSRILSHAEKRLGGLKSISPTLELGNDLSADRFASTIADLRQKLEDYNKILSIADALRLEVKAIEEMLADLSEKMLVGVAHQYGKNSYEYTMAGGVKKSERKSPRRQPLASVSD